MSLKSKLLGVVAVPFLFVLWAAFFAYSCYRHGNIRLNKCDRSENCSICKYKVHV